MPYSAIKVANRFLTVARAEGKTLTPLQLIKLVYIAHGWSLTFLPDRPLLNESAQAWQYGPVIPSLYQAVKHCRSGPIEENLIGDTDPQEIEPDHVQLIDAVYNRYKHLTGTQLSALTHKADTPWSETWAAAGKNAVIPNNLIAHHYGKLANHITGDAG